jgi:hypothetical protein
MIRLVCPIEPTPVLALAHAGELAGSYGVDFSWSADHPEQIELEGVALQLRAVVATLIARGILVRWTQAGEA